MATAPTPGTTSNGQSDELVAEVTIKGRSYSLDMNQLTSDIEMELYQQSGLTIGKIFELPGATFAVQAVWFLARRIAGEKVADGRVTRDVQYRDCVLSMADIQESMAVTDDEVPEPNGVDAPNLHAGSS